MSDGRLAVGDWIVVDDGTVVEVVAFRDGVPVVRPAGVTAVPQPRPAGGPALQVQVGWVDEGSAAGSGTTNHHVLSTPVPGVPGVAEIAEAMRVARQHPGTEVIFGGPDAPPA